METTLSPSASTVSLYSCAPGLFLRHPQGSVVEETGQGRWFRAQRAQGSDVAIATIPSVGRLFPG